MSPISWVKRDAWQIFCPLIKGYFPANVRLTLLLISASDYTLPSCSVGSQCRFAVHAESHF